MSVFNRRPRVVDDGARIVPVVDRTYTDGQVPWPTIPLPDATYVIVEAASDMPEKEFGFVLAELLQVRDRAGEAAENIIRTALADADLSFHLYPGLRVIGSDGRTIPSGCCCCLGEWREWLDVLEGGYAFLGHDPSPGITVQGDYVRIWSDSDLKEQSQAFEIAMSVEHYKAALEGMRLDLVAIGERIREWAIPLVGEDSADWLRLKFDRDFSVSADFRSERE